MPILGGYTTTADEPRSRPTAPDGKGSQQGPPQPAQSAARRTAPSAVDSAMTSHAPGVSVALLTFTYLVSSWPARVDTGTKNRGFAVTAKPGPPPSITTKILPESPPFVAVGLGRWEIWGLLPRIAAGSFILLTRTRSAGEHGR